VRHPALTFLLAPLVTSTLMGAIEGVIRAAQVRVRTTRRFCRLASQPLAFAAATSLTEMEWWSGKWRTPLADAPQPEVTRRSDPT